MNYIHDNEIVSYQVELMKKIITLHTDYKGQKIDIIFNGVMAHLFENEMPGSIILDIGEYPISTFIESNRKLLDERKDYCWPIYYENLEELNNILINEQYLYFVIYSSLGLNGWILAKDIEIKKLKIRYL